MKRLIDSLFYTVTGRWVLVLMAYLAVAGGILVAQDAAGTQVTDVPQLTSVGAIVGLSITATYILKNALANVPVLSKLPVWAYVCLASLGLTFLANRVLGTLEGDFVVLAWSAVYNAAAASGFREWVYNGVTKPLSASATGTK